MMVIIMNNLNLNWKSFKISDIFETIGNQVPTGCYINKRELIPGLIPRITVRDTNNGIDSYCESINSNFRVYENFISVSFLGSVFYHPYKASIDMKVHALLLKDRPLNRNLAEYFKVIIRANTYNFSYGNQLSSKDLARLKIMLPIKDDETPNFEYMENCIAEILDGKVELVKRYCNDLIMNIEPQKVKNLEEKKWNKFRINDLFNIVIGRAIDGNKVNRENGNVAYITRKESNNALDGFINYADDYMNLEYPVITIGNETAKPFVQTYPFFTGTKVNIMKPKFKANKYILFFISQSLEQHKNKYSYSYTINSTRLKEQIILLPVNQENEPDYEYMEQYIKNIMFEQYSRYLQFLED